MSQVLISSVFVFGVRRVKTQLLPACILALALLIAAYGVRTGGSAQIDGVLKALEVAASEKDANGKTQIARIAANVVESATQGAKVGWGGDRGEEEKAALALAERLAISEVKIVSSSFKGKERVIGVIKNNSDKTLKDIQLNVVFRDASGGLVDVAGTFARVSGPLLPGTELGFEVDRSFGGMDSSEDALAPNRAASATVRVQSLRVVE